MICCVGEAFSTMRQMRRTKVGIVFFWVVAVGLLGLIFWPPQWLLTRVLSPAICPGAVYAAKTSEKIAALTIDDGPDLRIGKGNSTAQILDVLQRHNQQATEFAAHATFFLIGNQVKQREDLSGSGWDAVTARIIEEGHEIGNHLAEDSASILLGDRFSQTFSETHQQLSCYAQVPRSQFTQVSWFRPGVGWCDRAMADAVSKQTEYLANEEIPKIALGSVWPYDTFQPWPVFSRWFIRYNIRPGSIIILHDRGSRGDRTVKVLSGLLQDLTKKKYKLVPLSILLDSGEPVSLSRELPKPIETIRKFFVVQFERLRL